jgi:hypothetical protein
VQLSICLFLLFTLAKSEVAKADPTFPNDPFMTKWQRADKPVNDITAKPTRSWLWGPESFQPPSGMTESYAQSPGGNRQVLYFDKARMEINNPANGQVTNGLLVRELISGKLASGDAVYIQRRAADDIPVAGDQANNNAPTYASFATIASLNNDNPSSDRTGQAASDTLDKNGIAGTNTELGKLAKYVYFDGSGLKHNIPDVFWNFMNQKGNVYINDKLVDNQPVLGDNSLAPWLDATGLPITDAYWTSVTLAGQVKNVLVQAFERRVLTYTPSNPSGFQVEMGNVGRHYFNWRYSPKYDIPVADTVPTPTPTPGTTSSCNNLPSSDASLLPKCGPAGMYLLLGWKANAKDKVTVTPIDPDGNAGTAINLTATASGDVNTTLETKLAYKSGMWTYKLTSSSGKTGNAYIWLDPPATKPTILQINTVGKTDTIFWFNIVGFKPDEQLNFTLKTPKSIGGTAYYKPFTNAQGSYLDTIRPLDDIHPTSEIVPGDYTYTVNALVDVNRYARVTFKILP